MAIPQLGKYESEEHKSQVPVHLLMIMSQALSGVYYVVTYAALTNGMNRIILSFYRDVLAMIVLIPAAYFIDKGNRLELSWYVVRRLAVLGLIGIYGSNYLLFVGIEYTSAEVSAAVQPAIPVLTCLFAIVFGIEVLRWGRRDGQVKAVGIVASCSGAILMTFYKGPAILSLFSGVGSGQRWTPTLNSGQEMIFEEETSTVALSVSGWQFGILCLIGNTICMATYINLQAPLLKKYPAPASILVYSYGVGAVFMGITGFFAVRDPEEWALGWNANLGVVFYNGVVASALNFGVMGWCLHRVGPLFVASYIPMQPCFSAILSLIFLGTTIYLGSVVGTVLIIVGLLLVSWSREETARLDSAPHSASHNGDNSILEPLTLTVA